ncbi:16S rRNA (guanine(966)-N(2))-methyltransferase RsmD [Acidiferrobacter sp.]|uniref:16S rRNA (guanine(966)-N(2))-methyltransferase RsmD n=1 Tax=Acidiferrobacter sp. TaxID=1872107 RepID=UPI00262CA0DB|nr:16S rRNA (guanine(966)-N(2))-methyltransferase RsmD [Acidiferrobacter sp.]
MRLIGGRWRRRLLAFPAVPGLRPTPDRVRETLFNWLAPWLAGARCLDLFAGTGALGLEALSRGAAAATLVDSHPAVVAALQENCERLGCEASIVASEACGYVATQGPATFDIIFLDPPFAGSLLTDALTLILARGILAPAGFIYIESAASGGFELPAGLLWHRHSRAGHVAFGLAARAS